ncbi:MAG: hypothetical protein RR790_08375, partial [Eubacterium sp.]
PKRYYDEMMAIIRSGKVIPYESYAAFITTPVIEYIQKASNEDKCCLGAYLFRHNHNELEVHNITELSIPQIKKIEEEIM